MAYSGYQNYDGGPVAIERTNGRIPGSYGYNGPANDKALSTSKTSLQSNGSSTSGKHYSNGYASTHSLNDFEDVVATIVLSGNAKRFGFSVMGGVDEGFPARIDELSADSPATETNLQVDDEILEVNGKTIHEASHAEIIMLIHKCIQKKSITLKIRRYFDSRPVGLQNGHTGSSESLPKPHMLNAIKEQNNTALEEQDGPYKHLTNGKQYINRTHGEPTVDDKVAISNEGFTREVCIDRVQPVARDPKEPEEQIFSTYTNPAFDLGEGEEGSNFGTAPDNVGTQKTLGMSHFIALLEHLKNKARHDGDKEKLTYLNRLINGRDFQAAVKTHNRMMRIQAFRRGAGTMRPMATNSLFLLSEVQEVKHLVMGLPTYEEEASELLLLMNKPHFQNLLQAHDDIAMREALNSFGDSDSDGSGDQNDSDFDDSYLDEETVKIVRIDKTSEPLGATVKNVGDAVVISRIVKGGAAEKSGLLHEGDEILEINGTPVKGKNINEVCELLSELEGTLKFVLVPAKSQQLMPEMGDHMYIKALFDYEPQDDALLPCQELGLSFRRGDLLEVLTQDDTNWWQARRIDDDTRLAGLIPSKSFQQERESLKITLHDDPAEPAKEKRRCLCLRGRKKKKKNSLKASGNLTRDLEDILTYEEMVEVDPHPYKKRPIVLIGPPKVGRRELRQELVSTLPDRFAAAIPHTSRPRGDTEVDGKDYYFVSEEEFLSGVTNHDFVEHGLCKGHYYGTSFKAIRDVVGKKKVCVLNLHCQALPVLKNSELRPYVIFITLPSFDEVTRVHKETSYPFNPTESVDDEELIELIEKAREMDNVFGHYFDYAIVNKELKAAYYELLKIVNFLETQPQWVPASWVK